MIEDRSQGLRDHGLETMTGDRQAEPGELGDDTRVSRYGHPNSVAGDPAAGGVDGGDAVATLGETLHLAVLDDVDTQVTRGARVAPSDGIVPNRTAPLLHQCA